MAAPPTSQFVNLSPRKVISIVAARRAIATTRHCSGAMRSNPEGSINDWATTVSKSQTSCVSALYRLRATRLAESNGGRWVLVEAEAPRASATMSRARAGPSLEGHHGCYR